MNWKTYKNELLVVISILMMFMAFAYKTTKVSSSQESVSETGTSVHELESIIALKKVWASKKTVKKLDKLKTLVPPSKVKWSKKSQKLQAKFSNLEKRELNKVVTNILNLAVEIQLLSLTHNNGTYNLEFACKW